MSAQYDFGHILQKAPCTHRDVVYTECMKLFSKKKVVYELTPEQKAFLATCFYEVTGVEVYTVKTGF